MRRMLPTCEDTTQFTEFDPHSEANVHIQMNLQGYEEGEMYFTV